MGVCRLVLEWHLPDSLGYQGINDTLLGLNGLWSVLTALGSSIHLQPRATFTSWGMGGCNGKDSHVYNVRSIHFTWQLKGVVLYDCRVREWTDNIELYSSNRNDLEWQAQHEVSMFFSFFPGTSMLSLNTIINVFVRPWCWDAFLSKKLTITVNQIWHERGMSIQYVLLSYEAAIAQA